MKIMFCVEENSLESKVSDYFGRAPGFLIYNLKNGEMRFLSNEYKNLEHGVSNKVIQLAIENDIDIVAAGNYGNNAVSNLDNAGIEHKIYKNQIVKDVLDEIKSKPVK